MTKKEYTNRDIQIESRLTKLEGHISSVKQIVLELRDNHLAHLKISLDELNTTHAKDVSELRDDYKKVLWWIIGTGLSVGLVLLKVLFDALK